MSKIKKCVVILGGGIRGTAIAALLAQSQQCKVVLLERDRIASGTSSTNQGRLHSGAGIWQRGFDAIAHRHRTGSQLIRQITDAVEKQEPGIYLVQSHEDIKSIEAIWQRYSIPHKPVSTSILSDYWIRGNCFAAAYEVPEYAFNPARLAGKFAAYARSLGAVIRTNSVVYEIDSRDNQKFSIRLTNGDSIEADIIINTLGNWVNQIHSELPLPKLPLEWHQWRILCLLMQPTSNDIILNRVITILEQDRSPSVVPHSPWVTFGCRLTPELAESQPETLVGTWQCFDINHEMDNILFEAHARYFLPLQSLTPEDMLQRLFSFSGIYPAFEKHREKPFRLLQSDKVPNYYVVYGENATTALLDALDTTHILLHQLEPSTPCFANDATRLLRKLSVDFTQNSYPDTAAMIWENMIEDPAYESPLQILAS